MKKTTKRKASKKTIKPLTIDDGNGVKLLPSIERPCCFEQKPFPIWKRIWRFINVFLNGKN